MKYQLNPTVINVCFLDWYRDYATSGDSDPHLVMGFDIKWAFEIRYEMNSPCANTYCKIHHLGVF